MKNVINDYETAKQETGCSDEAAAILVLSNIIENTVFFNKASGENFGHELACALKNVLKESTITIKDGDKYWPDGPVTM